MSIDWLGIVAVLALAALKTVSYGSWTLKKQKNIMGGLMLYLLAAVTVGLPLYTIFFRK